MKKAIIITLIIVSTCGVAYTALRGQTNALICFALALLISLNNLKAEK